MKLLVFNLDNSVYNIPNFYTLFLSKDSPFNLFKNKVVFMTNKKWEKAKAELEEHKELKYTYLKCTCYKRKEFLLSYTKKWNKEDVYCFGATEKDANIYSHCKLGFYIVNKFNGYELDTNKIERIIEINRNNTWRESFLYDSKFEESDHKLFTPALDTVVYYKCYLDTKRFDKNTGKLTGCDYAPEIDNRKPLKVFTQAEFGQTKKNINILHHLDSFASLFKEVYIDNSIILVRIPGHDEVSYRANSMSKFVAKIIEQHHAGVDGSCFLRRSRVTIAAKEEERNCLKHLQTIEVIKEAKELIKDRTIYLFDDICTSGSTMLAASYILKKAGAREVVCFCIAHTCTTGKYLPRNIR